MKRYIEVTGQGVASQTADQVQVRLNLMTRQLDYPSVLDASEKRRKELQAALEALGFKKDILSTTSYSLNTYYEQDLSSPVYRNVFAGYELHHGLTMTFPHDHQSLSDLLVRLTTLEGKPEFHLEFNLKDPKKLMDEARQAAVLDATAKAKQLADATGVMLGEVLIVQSGGERYDAPMLRSKSFAMAEVDIPVGERDVTQSVTIRFAIA